MTLKLIVGFVVIIAAVVEAVTPFSALLVAALGLIFAAERFFSDDDMHPYFLVGGFLLLAVSIGLRSRKLLAATGVRRVAETRALMFGGVATSSLVLYGLTTARVTGLLGLEGHTLDAWHVVWSGLWPIAMISGVLPMLLIDRALASHPVVMPASAIVRATEAGLSAAFGIALLFPVNYVASIHGYTWDVSYFKVTAPGESTIALVSGLDEPIEATLFFPPGSDVLQELRGYFDQIESASGGKLAVTITDQAVDPKLAEDLKIRENGWVVFKRGDHSEKFKIGTDMDKAKRELKKLDETVQKNLLKIARGERNAYMLVGHGEASSKEKDEPLRKLNTFKQLLESQNYKVKNLGVMDGSANAVPDDAAIVIIAAPEKAILPEETAAIEAFLQKGGRVLVMVEPAGNHAPELLSWLGLEAGSASVDNKTFHVAQTRGPADYALIATNRFGTHEVTSTLSKFSTQAYVLMPTTDALSEIAGATNGKRTVLLRSPDGSWIDGNGNYEQDPDEKSDTFNLGYAVNGDVANPVDGGNKEWRAVVLGDVSVFSDPVLEAIQGNQQLILDATRWLVGDEDISGKIENEEDVKIEHTKQEDAAWFYGTIFGVPLLVLGFGALFTTIRRRAR